MRIRTADSTRNRIRTAWRRRILPLVDGVLRMIALCAAVFVVTEAGLRLLFLYRDRPAEGSADSRATADAYGGQSWPAAYYREFDASYDVVWSPYVYWRRKPFQGTYINVDSDGLRRTVGGSHASARSAHPLRIFVFGGSTVWGTGARDAFTIPSVLARELAVRGVRAEIVNFGETGYVSTQETIKLLLELRKGNIPDLVIFYDGVNDTFAAYQYGAAGVPQNELNREREFNLTHRNRRAHAVTFLVQDIARELALLRAARRGLALIGGSIEASPSDRAARGDRPNDLVAGVVSAYLGNVKLVRAVATQYGFEVLFYWQPTIFQKSYLTPYERTERDKWAEVQGFFERTYRLIGERFAALSGGLAVHDISSIFRDRREPLYLDWCHPGEIGNTLIAQHLAADVERLVRKSRLQNGGLARSDAERGAADLSIP